MRLVRGHDQHLARVKRIGRAGNRDLDRAIERVDQRIIRRGVLAQALPRIESEQRHRAGATAHDLAAHHRAGLHLDQSVQLLYLGLCHHRLLT